MVSFSPNNLDLISLGVAIAAIAILGFIVYLNNYKSITNKTFLLFAFVTIVYSIFNYLSYKVTSLESTLWFLRLTIFAAVWHAFTFFQLFYVFPKDEVILPKKYKGILVPVVFFASLLTLTPLVFSKLSEVSTTGQVSDPERGPGIAVFGLTVVFLVVGGIYHLFKKTIKSKGLQRNQFFLVLIGTVITFSSIIIFNFVLPVVFKNLALLPLAPVFFIPFIVLTAYAIMKYHLLNVKVIATEILTFFLAIAMLFEVIISNDVGIAIFRFLIFCLVLGVGLMLIRSVVREVKQREELQLLTGKLKTANRDLKILDQARADFITMASHQLRTPPATIKWYLAAVLKNEFGTLAGELKTAIENINLTNDSLISLVDDMLNVSRIERGKLEFIYEPTDLAAITELTVKQLVPLAKQKNLALNFMPPTEKFPLLMADKEKLRQVVNNLIDNAIKYTKTGSVAVSVEKQSAAGGGNLVIKVADTGKGLTPEDAKAVFEKYSRGRDSNKYSAGLGLGLYLAKVVAEAHKGKIWAESKGPDQGSTFIVSLPIESGLKETAVFDLTKR